MTNFDYLKKEPKFDSFVDIAISAERFIIFDFEVSIFNCRRAMEMAIKWMYSVDKLLESPYQDKLQTLMNTDDFRQMIDVDLWRRLDFIRKCGNQVAHSGKKQSWDKAMLCLENLFLFFDYISYCYSEHYEERKFQPQIILDSKQKAINGKREQEDTKQTLKIREEELAKRDIDLEVLLRENAKLKEELSAHRQEKQPNYVPKPLDLSEFETRKIYIDVMLEDAGWMKGKNWEEELPVDNMPTKSGIGKVDYVLYDDRHIPLAIVEAKKTCEDVAVGRQQAKLYADSLEKKHGCRPVIFLTNGFETRIFDGQYPERKCAAIYSKRDLEKWFNLRSMRTSLKNIQIDKNIAGRYYQEAAIKAVCQSFDEKNRRKALLVMATGSGKTRTVIALCKVLLNAGWVKNILFLADRNALVRQAKNNFVSLLPSLSCTNLCEEKDNYNAHCVLSTYQTMINCVDSVSDDDGRLYTCGHFDLIICDEAHRSIYNKYKEIFHYFDAPLVGLTATPKDEVDKNTYEIFELEKGVPTYGYELAQAVKDGYLVDYISIETTLKFLEQGIVYDELSEEEKEDYEKTFADKDGRIPERIESSALNTWVFNSDTIRQVLDILMTKGLKVDYGQKIGKTIIFAKRHDHAEKILEIFNKEYPHLKEYAGVIDNQINYAQSVLDDFSDSKKLPQIAISVDMLDTGIDVPEILNLVFFKKVLSKAKFWQMIGRGTRLCPGLMDGADKHKFYIFDFCNNFDFFRLSKGKESGSGISLQTALFQLEFELVFRLKDSKYQTEELKAFREFLIRDMCHKVKKLPRDSFVMKQHLKHVDLYSEESGYQNISFQDIGTIKEELAPFIIPDKDDVSALRFDALLYGIEVCYLKGEPYNRAKNDLRKKVKAISEVLNISEIDSQSAFIQTLLHTDYIDQAGISEMEEIRERLRGLTKYIVGMPNAIYETAYDDEMLDMKWNEAKLENEELHNYKKKAEFYIRQHQDHIVIAKLKTNKPLSAQDIKMLEQIMWKEIGTRKEYEKEYGEKPLGEFVREIVGLDMNAAKEAFSKYLLDAELDYRQIHFLNHIVEYIVQNGMMKDLRVLQDAPFTNNGSIIEIFTDMELWNGIRQIIESINANAVA